MIYYEALVGSQCYGIDIEDSDIDIIVCASKESELDSRRGSNPEDYHWIDPSKLLDRIFFQDIDVNTFGVEIYFPKTIITETAISEFLKNNRTALLRANPRGIYSTYLRSLITRLKNLDVNGDWQKQISYALLYSNTLLKYEKNLDLEESFFPTKEEQLMYREIRKGNQDSEKNELLQQIDYKLNQIYAMKSKVDWSDYSVLSRAYNECSKLLNGAQSNLLIL